MEFFLSKRDRLHLLVMDSASKTGNVFKVAAEETWKLVWSGLVTENFLESPDWEWETRTGEYDPSQFPGGWPRLV